MSTGKLVSGVAVSTGKLVSGVAVSTVKLMPDGTVSTGNLVSDGNEHWMVLLKGRVSWPRAHEQP